jgi:hypothetical protein
MEVLLIIILLAQPTSGLFFKRGPLETYHVMSMSQNKLMQPMSLSNGAAACKVLVTF